MQVDEGRGSAVLMCSGTLLAITMKARTMVETGGGGGLFNCAGSESSLGRETSEKEKVRA